MQRDSGSLSERNLFRELLLTKKSELIAELGLKMPALTESGRLAEDDQAQVLHDQFVSAEVQLQCYRTLKQIDAALDRLDTGDYGVCLNCGEPISPRRLAAIPWAARCIQCQERLGHDVEEFSERAA